METSTPILAKLRLKLAETYDESAGETESDTLFTDEQLKIVLRESATLLSFDVKRASCQLA